jgi:hypothetical protein
MCSCWRSCGQRKHVVVGDEVGTWIPLAFAFPLPFDMVEIQMEKRMESEEEVRGLSRKDGD